MVLFLYLFLIFTNAKKKPKIKYSVMVDAGSSGTRAHIYQWEKARRGIPNVIPSPSKENGLVLKSKIPLAKSHKNITIISEIFMPIIKFATENIPTKNFPTTRIFVYATAGVRLLDEKDREFVINETYNFLEKYSPFKLKRRYVRCITGTEEGIYGWLSVNHLMNKLTSKSIFGKFRRFSTGTIGALDMGGASSQIAIQIKDSTESSSQHYIDLGYKTLKLFVHSYLGYGGNEALKSISRYLKETNTTYHPCYPMHCPVTYKGINFTGTGNFERCSELIEKVLLTKKEFKDIIIPHETNEYIAMASYYYLNNFLNLPLNSTLNQLKTSAIQFCAKNWSTSFAENSKNPFLKSYCFSGVYQWNFLSRGFGFNDGKTSIVKTENIEGVDLSWAIGAMLKEASDIEVDDNPFISPEPLVVMNLFLALNFLITCLLGKRKKKLFAFKREECI